MTDAVVNVTGLGGGDDLLSGPPSKLRLLEAGAAVLAEQGVSLGIGVKLTDAAQRAGLTTGAAYNIWPTQEAFRRDVAKFALRTLLTDEQPEVIGAARGLIGAGNDLPTMVRVMASLALGGLMADPGQIALVYSLYASAFVDDELRVPAKAGYDQVTDTYRQVYDEVLTAGGREMAPPWTLADLTAALTALTDGFIVRWHVDPGAVDRTEQFLAPTAASEEEWTLYGVAALGIVHGMTRPAG